MPDFTRTGPTLRPDLGTFSQLDLEIQRRGYVATRILPGFEVRRSAGTFGVITLKSLLANKDAETKRAPRGGYNEGDYDLEDRSYQTQEHGWKERIDDREREMYADYLNGQSDTADEIATSRAWEQLLHNLDKRVIKAAITDLPSAQKVATATKWDVLATADPAADIEAAVMAVWARTGIMPDTLTISLPVYRKLRNCKTILDRISSLGAGDRTLARDVNLQKLAEVFDLRQVVVAGAIGNSANRAKDAVLETVFPKTVAMVHKAAETNDFKEPCLGRIFHWGGDGSRMRGGDPLVGVVEEYRDEDVRSDFIRVRHETNEFILYPEMGQLITGVL